MFNPAPQCAVVTPCSDKNFSLYYLPGDLQPRNSQTDTEAPGIIKRQYSGFKR